MIRKHRVFPKSQGGYTVVEFVVAIVVFGIIVIGISNAYQSARFSYTAARQLNEMYAVLSACPELDRALEYSSLSSSTNCYPNNIFNVEDTTVGAVNTYDPTITITNTSDLDAADPLRSVTDSKVVDLQVGFPPPNEAFPDLRMRVLITRNGIGQL